jgi:hypothetical protein
MDDRPDRHGRDLRAVRDPSNEKGEIIGFEVDYAKALCAKMKLTCTFQNQDWDGIIPSLLASKFDVILSSMNETPARMKKVAVLRRLLRDGAGHDGDGREQERRRLAGGAQGQDDRRQSSTVFANYLQKYYKVPRSSSIRAATSPISICRAAGSTMSPATSSCRRPSSTKAATAAAASSEIERKKAGHLRPRRRRRLPQGRHRSARHVQQGDRGARRRRHLQEDRNREILQDRHPVRTSRPRCLTPRPS